MTIPSQKAIDFAEQKIVPADGNLLGRGDGYQIEGLPFVVTYPSWISTVPEKTEAAFREGLVLALARLLDEYAGKEPT
jgi:hypothetical protein